MLKNLPMQPLSKDAAPASNVKQPPGRLRRTTLLLINLGTPQGTDTASVRRYLAEFLSDPDVIRLPRGFGWLNGFLGRTIARFRARGSAHMYRKIWTDRGSPLRIHTEEQVEALRKTLPPEWRVHYAMRYGHPSIDEAIAAIETSDVEELIVIPMYPHYSGPTTGTALRVLHERLARFGHRMHVTILTSWYDDAGYVHAQADRINQFAASKQLTPEDTFLLFSAHGLPVSYVTQGDPYAQHVERSVELVRRQMGWPQHRAGLAYQSVVGPVRWLEPHTDTTMIELARSGERRILVCPISFTADCLETLEELNLRYRVPVEQAGAELHLCPALNAHPPFINALKSLALRGALPIMEPTPEREEKTKPVLDGRVRSEPAGERGETETLVMIGASLRGRLGPGRGPLLDYSTPDGFRRVKRSQCEVPEVLRSILADTPIEEAWLWNTCQRIELYGRIGGKESADERADIIRGVCRHLFSRDDPSDVQVNALWGEDAKHHLLRTAAGLNSDLPGERDIVEQLQAAHRLAGRAGTAGGFTDLLIADTLAREGQVRLDTEWGRFHPDYTYAALNRIIESSGLRLDECRIVVIGGSTTSAGVLHTFMERFEVPSRQVTLLYRGHRRGGQTKILRKAIGQGQRIRVQSYQEQAVQRAIAEADVVVFGVDRNEPVLSAEQLRGSHDRQSRPLTIFDFNLFGSTVGLDTFSSVTLYDARSLEAEVASFADRMCASKRFTQALQTAEVWLQEHALERQANFQGEPTGDIVCGTVREAPVELVSAGTGRSEILGPPGRPVAGKVLEGRLP